MTATQKLTSFPVPPVVKAVDVSCDVATAFARFTRDIGTWWPTKSHSLQGENATGAVLEPMVGGRLFERGTDGSEKVWGKVTVWEPPSRVAFAWHPGRDPGTAQTVEVTFGPVAAGTRVQLVHAGWENLHSGSEQMRAEYDNGWNAVFLQSYAAHANSPVP